MMITSSFIRIVLIFLFINNNDIVISNSLVVPVTTTTKTLLSDLPTPCFVLDIKTLRHNCINLSSTKKVFSWEDHHHPPNLYLENYDMTLVSTPFLSLHNNDDDDDGDDDESSSNENQRITTSTTNSEEEKEPINLLPWSRIPGNSMSSGTDVGIGAFAYVHASVIPVPNHDNNNNNNDGAVLAQLDVTPNVLLLSKEEEEDQQQQPLEEGSSSSLLQLVLGLNNHHTGSYYWARAAGKGSSMEAPGIQFVPTDGTLRWQDDNIEQGFINCNSNDGKRSEWVNFLRIGDTVQLVPYNSSISENILMSFAIKQQKSTSSSRIFGISMEGRPMGSEPAVICQWNISQ